MKRALRYYYIKFIRLKGDPDVLARGVAIGIFIGITPTIPLHTGLDIFFALAFRASKIAALLASMMVSNPLTFFLQYYFSWCIGNWLTPRDLSWARISQVMDVLTSEATFRETLQAIMDLGVETITVMVLGGCLLALPLSVTGYFASLRFFTVLQKKRVKRRLKRAMKNDEH
ncbi:MAG: DUF2062 domain-containing protein [Desulfobulbaceae bacterium]|nr:DUF2062 domain-containing protein [Desulfobulbaceae bacterium]